jgi:hypothetical protein
MVKKNNIVNLNSFLRIIEKNLKQNKPRLTKQNLPKIFQKDIISLDIRNY